MVVKGAWVEIEKRILDVGERAPQVPEDTKNTPLMMWIRGSLQDQEASLGDEVTILTLSGRRVQGKLVDEQAGYTHSFGQSIKELLEIERTLS